MRHRLFHAVVLAALPGCGSSDPPVTPDVTKDTGVVVQPDTTTSATDSSPAADSAPKMDSAVDTSVGETCIDGCGKDCLPCIK